MQHPAKKDFVKQAKELMHPFDTHSMPELMVGALRFGYCDETLVGNIGFVAFMGTIVGFKRNPVERATRESF